MEKSDYIYMIIDNMTVYDIEVPEIYRDDNLFNYLNNFDEQLVKIIAGFNQKLLEYFLNISKDKSPDELKDKLEKMELISYMVGPTGNLNYLSPSQVDYILSKLENLKLKEITEQKINSIVDKRIEDEFGSAQYSTGHAFENQLSSAAFYLMNMGYSRREIEQKLSEVRSDPSKLGLLFSLPQKEIYSVPSEIQNGLEN